MIKGRLELKRDRVYENVDIIFIGLFFISFLNSLSGILFYILLLYYLKSGIKGCIKILILATTRGILNPALASDTNGTNIKLAVILLASLYIVIYAKPELKDVKKINITFFTLFLFCVYTIISSLFFSSYPTTATFKVISFALPFMAILKGISATYDRYDWKKYFGSFYLILFIISIFLIPFDRFRVVNDDFQGIFNHVNVFGIVSALFLAVIIDADFMFKLKGIKTIIIGLILFMIYLSASRTGLFISILVILAYFVFSKRTVGTKIFYLLCFIGLTVIILAFVPNNQIHDIQSAIHDFIWKNNAENILDSRLELIEAAKQKYENNPLFGSGFMVPYKDGIYNVSLQFGLIVEPGNIFWAILGDTGLIGAFLFILFILSILFQGSLKNIYLIIGAFGVNFGEMVFFSSNNMSIIIYLLIALYLFDNKNQNLKRG